MQGVIDIMQTQRFHWKKSFTILSLAVSCAVPSTSVQAQAAIVTIQGALTSDSCTASVNGGSPVTLPNAKESDIPNVGNTTGETPFTVSVTDCGGNTGKTVKAYFYANHVTNGRLNITSGGGAGWQYQLLPATGTTQLDVQTSATPSNNAGDSGVVISGSSANVNYRVRYYRSASAVTVGSGNTTVNLALFFI